MFLWEPGLCVSGREEAFVVFFFVRQFLGGGLRCVFWEAGQGGWGLGFGAFC